MHLTPSDLSYGPLACGKAGAEGKDEIPGAEVDGLGVVGAVSPTSFINIPLFRWPWHEEKTGCLSKFQQFMLKR